MLFLNFRSLCRRAELPDLASFISRYLSYALLIITPIVVKANREFVFTYNLKLSFAKALQSHIRRLQELEQNREMAAAV